jgi:hypothetical protein
MHATVHRALGCVLVVPRKMICTHAREQVPIRSMETPDADLRLLTGLQERLVHCEGLVGRRLSGLPGATS